MDKIAFGNKIKQLREAKGLKHRDVARDLDIGQGLWSRYEQGKVVPSLEKGVQIAQYFNVSLDELAGIKPSQIQKPSQNVDAFIEIMESVITILRNEKRRDIIDGLRGFVKHIAERRGEKDVAKKMSRKIYKKIA